MACRGYSRPVGTHRGQSAAAAAVTLEFGCCEELIERLREMTGTEVEILPGITENVRFRMPSQLTDGASRS